MAEHRKVKPKTPVQPNRRRANGPTNYVAADFDVLNRSLFDALPFGIVLFDRNLQIIRSNSLAGKLIKLNRGIDKSLAAGTGSKASPQSRWRRQLKLVLSTGRARRFEKTTYRFFDNHSPKLLTIDCVPLAGDTCKSAKDTAAVKNNRIAGPAGAVILEDITEQVAVRNRLAEAERLAAVGKVVSRVAHELNNPIDGILRYINLAIRVLDQQKLEKPKDYLDQCRRGLMRMVQILNELLQFSAGSGLHCGEYTRIEQIIDEAVKMMEPLAERSKIKINKTFSRKIPELAAVNLFQVFVNIIKNALEAMPDGGQLNITTYLSPDNMAVAEFQDSGPGVQLRNSSAIFEPFFTTKTKMKGTGLGLAICKDIINRYNGHITVRNGPKGGSIFTVYLPIKSN